MYKNLDQSTQKKKSSATGTLFMFLILLFAIMAAFSLSGGSVPLDPNDSGGPPTLPPYYSSSEADVKQELIIPTNVNTSETEANLQLKSFKVNTCMNEVAVDFLIDTSGSFAYDNKLDNLKNALRAFTKRMSNLTVIGMQSFSAKVYERVPLDYYKNQKLQTDVTIDNLTAAGNTRTRSGFLLAQKLIMEAKNANKFKGYHYVLVLMTDGIPELNPSQPRTCEGPEVPDPLTAPALRCFAREEDPRYPTNIADELKANDVSIYSVGIYSPNRPSDAALQPQLEDLLQDVASDPVDDHYFSSIHGGNLETILDNIFEAICQK